MTSRMYGIIDTYVAVIHSTVRTDKTFLWRIEYGRHKRVWQREVG